MIDWLRKSVTASLTVIPKFANNASALDFVSGSTRMFNDAVFGMACFFRFFNSV
jgi:hypothetical protein